MLNHSYSESEVSFGFDYLICNFEKDLSRRVVKSWTDKDFVDFLFSSMWLQEIIGQRQKWVWLLNLPDREYCPRISLFFKCVTEYFEQYPELNQNNVLLQIPLTVILMITLNFAKKLLSLSYSRIRSDRKYQAKVRERDISEKLKQLSARKSRLLPFRFELYYRENYAYSVSSVELRIHLERFVKEINKPEHYVLTEVDRNKVDLEILFYARVVEQGKKYGHFHIHFMVILDGKHLQTPYRFHQAATKIWHQITEGNGYLSVQNKKNIRYPMQHYINGQVIDRKDTERVKILMNYVAPYLTKIGTDCENQYLRIKSYGFEAYACSHFRTNKVK
ncbi:inovirus-type Gp2 protein [Acinetobacter haemolyticus]|uniref:inovirus-type Gp2 protein n=1 Tax=Acinetobacter haemolyticus TaxID=29430 RepID=UPI000DEA5E4E|nr:inovirus-type Gp2 protein [Acinetobacter haemolyticus]WHR57417.1 inovirus-type Gp2 protein [Acinetobacter haemolyticus]